MSVQTVTRHVNNTEPPPKEHRTMSQEVGQTELKAKTQQLLDGPLKHIRAAALAAALLPLASVAATPASAQTCVRVGRRLRLRLGTTRTTTAFRMRARPALKASRCRLPSLRRHATRYRSRPVQTGSISSLLPDGHVRRIAVQIPTGTQPSPAERRRRRRRGQRRRRRRCGYSVADVTYRA